MSKRIYACLSIIIVLASGTAVGQQYDRIPHKYEKNDHVFHVGGMLEGKAVVQYIFKDHWEVMRGIELKYDSARLIYDVLRFGVPAKVFHGYYASEKDQLKREVETGLFKWQGNDISANYSAMLVEYSDTYCRPIAQQIVKWLSEDRVDTKRNRIELAMKFVQDIPYGIPRMDDAFKHMGGVIPIPLLLIFGYGDCDSKTALFVGILLHLIDSRDIVILHQKSRKHVFSAVRAYKGYNQGSISYNGNDYIFSESTGPARYDFGKVPAEYYATTYQVEPLRLRRSYHPIPYGPNDGGTPALAYNTDNNSQKYEDNTYYRSYRSNTTSHGGYKSNSTSHYRSGNMVSYTEFDRQRTREMNSSFFRIGMGVSSYQGAFDRMSIFDANISEYYLNAGIGIPLGMPVHLLIQASVGDFRSMDVVRSDVSQISGFALPSHENNYFWDIEVGLLFWKFASATFGGMKYEVENDMPVDLPEVELWNYFVGARVMFKFGAISFDPEIKILGHQPFQLSYLKTSLSFSYYFE